VGRWRRARLGATTRQAPACKEKHHGRARRQWLNRVRSAVTQVMKLFVNGKVSIHTVYPAKRSGQLPNLGLLDGQ
jgi:hypothetical protein